MKKSEQPNLAENPLFADFTAFAEKEALFSADTAVLCALSGGADSVTLLHLLQKAKAQGLLSEVCACHVHHGLRGENADRDEQFCKELCAAWGVPLTVKSVDVPAAVAQTGESVEQAARRLRYAVLNEVANGKWIATAHTASDNAETVLLHLTRGSGLRGLSGISPKRDNLLRPLLFATRQQVEAYAAENGLSFVNDETNDDLDFSRNRIRAEVMPALKALNPKVETALLRLGASLREDEACLRDQGQLLLECAEFEDAPATFDRDVLKTAPPAILRRALLQMLPTDVDVTKAHLDRLAALVTDGEEQAVTIAGGVTVRRSDTAVWVDKSPEPIAPFCFPLTIGEPIVIAGEPYEARLYTAEEFKKIRNVYSLFFHFCCDYDTIVGSVTVRSRENGDAFRPVGRGTKKLKKLFEESGLDASQREKTPLLCDKNGIFLVDGFGCDERVKLTDTTKTVLVFAKAYHFPSN